MKVPKELTKVTPLSKTLTVVAFLTFVIIGLLLGKAYQDTLIFRLQNTPSTQPAISRQPTSTQDETANWRTYINTDYDYQLKYPKTLRTEIPKNAPQVFIIHFLDKDEYVEVQIGPTSSLGLNKEIESDMQRANPFKTTFQNKPAVLIRPARNIYPGEPFKAIIIYVEDKKFKIEIGYYGDGRNEALFDQILSTFKFTQ